MFSGPGFAFLLSTVCFLFTIVVRTAPNTGSLGTLHPRNVDLSQGPRIRHHQTYVLYQMRHH